MVVAASALTTAAENNASTSGAVNTIKNFIDSSIPAVKGESLEIVDKLKPNDYIDELNNSTAITDQIISAKGFIIRNSKGSNISFF